MSFLAKYAKYLLSFIAFLGIWASVFMADVALSKQSLQDAAQKGIQNIERLVGLMCEPSKQLSGDLLCDFGKLFGPNYIGDFSIISRDGNIVYANHEVKTNDLLILEDSSWIQKYSNPTNRINRSDLYQTARLWKRKITLAKITNSRLPDFSNDKLLIARKLLPIGGDPSLLLVLEKPSSLLLVLEKPYYKDEFWTHVFNKTYLLPILVLLSIFFMLIEANRSLVYQHIKKTKKYVQDLGSFTKTEQIIPPVPAFLSTDKDFENLGESIRNLRKKLELRELLNHELMLICHQLTGHMANGAAWLEIGTSQVEIDRAKEAMRAAKVVLDNQLAYSKLTDQKILKKEITSVRDLINKAVSICEKITKEKNLVIRFNPPPNEIPLRGAEELLIEVFKNVLENAHNASPEDSTITIKLDKVGRNIRIRVSDEGSGLTDREIKNIENGDIFTGTGGHGYGIRFIKRIVNDHDGEFSIKNRRIRKGAEVTISFRQRSDLHQAQGHTLPEPQNHQNINELPAYRPLPSEEERDNNKNTTVGKGQLFGMIALGGCIFFLIDSFLVSV